MRWTKDLATQSILELHRAGVPVNYRALTQNKSFHVRRILKKVTGQNVSPLALYASSINLFGDWDSSLKKAGIEPAKVRRDKKYWTKPLVIKAIRALHNEGVALGPSQIQYNSSARSSAILYKALKNHTNGKGVYIAAIRRFPSWNAALQEAQVPYKSLWVRNRFWNPSLIIRCLQELNSNNFALNSAFINRDPTNQVRKLVEQIVKHRTSGSRLVVAARTHFGSWQNALEAAGLETPEKSRNAKRFWTRELILIAIKEIAEGGHFECIGLPSRNCAPKVKALLLQLTGFSTDTAGLARGAKKIFGNWNEAVRQAGFDREDYRTDRVSNKAILRTLQELHKNGEPLNDRFAVN